MKPLKQGVTIRLDQADLALILTELICEPVFTLFKGLECYRVRENPSGSGQFLIDLAPPLPRVQAKPVQLQSGAAPVLHQAKAQDRPAPVRSENQAKVEAGIARARALTPERRSEIARHAGQARWAKARAEKETRQ